MTYTLIEGQVKRVYILFHGTGGSEFDLVQMAKFIDHDAYKIGLLGNVLESGMRRFFKRIKPGVFDLENLVEETHAIYQHIQVLKKTHSIDEYEFHAVGYSNGANMIASLTFHYPDLFKSVYLFHPMQPFKYFDYPNLSQLKVFIAASKEDPIVPIQETLGLISIYEKMNAYLEVYWSNRGHQITSEAIIEAHQFMLKATES
jgi:phospholipase/carboxylesterase